MDKRYIERAKSKVKGRGRKINEALNKQKD